MHVSSWGPDNLFFNLPAWISCYLKGTVRPCVGVIMVPSLDWTVHKISSFSNNQTGHPCSCASGAPEGLSVCAVFHRSLIPKESRQGWVFLGPWVFDVTASFSRQRNWGVAEWEVWALSLPPWHGADEPHFMPWWVCWLNVTACCSFLCLGDLAPRMVQVTPLNGFH